MHITNPFANPEKIIGICGGGQLGKMLCEAASAWDWKTAVLDQSPDDPAARLAHKFVQGDWAWHANRGNVDNRSIWHNYKGKSRFNMLFGDGHVEFYLFPDPKIMEPWIWSPAPDPEFTWW